MDYKSKVESRKAKGFWFRVILHPPMPCSPARWFAFRGHRAGAFLSFILCCVIAANSATAQQYPVRSIRLVLGFAPGGASDTMARTLAAKLSEGLGQTIVIDNRPGAGGNIAAEIVAKSNPDGYTMLLGNNGILSINVSLYEKPGFHPLKDFAPVVLAASQPNIVAVHPSVPAKSIKELIALAKAKPGQLNYASSGGGTSPHLAGELFKRMAGVDFVLVPFKGGGPAVVAVISGQCQFIFATSLSVQAHMKAGKVRALAVTTPKRSASFPELPTVSEAGLPGFEVTTWHGFVVPARTPQPIVARLNTEFNKVFQQPEIRERLTTLGSEIIGGQPKELTDLIKKEIPVWAKVIKETGAKAD
jgi:tripartite-type tricarboxylate transporter receptor subunit TctC